MHSELNGIFDLAETVVSFVRMSRETVWKTRGQNPPIIKKTIVWRTRHLFSPHERKGMGRPGMQRFTYSKLRFQESLERTALYTLMEGLEGGQATSFFGGCLCQNHEHWEGRKATIYFEFSCVTVKGATCVSEVQTCTCRHKHTSTLYCCISNLQRKGRVKEDRHGQILTWATRDQNHFTDNTNRCKKTAPFTYI